MMRRRLLAAGIFAGALLLGAAAMAQETGQGTIGGQVLGPNGKAAVGARVTLQTADGKRPQTTITNTQGRFWFPSLGTGPYDLRAYAEGRLSEWQRNVWVDRGKQTNVTLRLRAKKPAPGKSGTPKK